MRLFKKIATIWFFGGISVFAATVPSSPTNVTATQVKCQLADSVAWAAPTSNGGSVITGYTVTSVQDTSKHCTTTGALNCTVANLTVSTAYSFIVKATNAFGTSPASSISNPDTVHAWPIPAPNPPMNVTAVPGNTQATVSWNASTPEGCETASWIYIVYSTISPSQALCSTTALTCTVIGLTNGMAYSFFVIAEYFDEAGGTSESGPSSNSNSVTPSSSLALMNPPAFSSQSIGIHIIGSSVMLQLPKVAGNARISMVDLLGNEVWGENLGSETNEVLWDGRANGRSVTRGMYILRLTQQNADQSAHLAAESKILLSP